MSELATLGNMPSILEIETVLKSLPQLEFTTEHYHIDGVYVRSLFIPKGAVLTGKIHNFDSIGILAHGTLRITNGDSFKIVTAPYITVDRPGVKRLGYAETDCTFITVHRTDNKELSDIEDELVSSTFEEYEQKRLGVTT